MKKTVLMIVLPIVAIVSAVVVLSIVFGIAPWLVRGSGPIGEKEYALEGFSQVEVSNAVEFELTESESYSVMVTGYENLIERLDVELSEQTLVVRLKPGTYFRNNIKAVIGMPELDKLTVSGASRGTAVGFVSTGVCILEISGASRADIDIEVGTVIMNVSGASRVTGAISTQTATLIISGASRCQLTGSSDAMNLDVSGASQAHLSEFPTENTNANVSGASKAIVNVTGLLNVDLSGASTLTYTGNPTLGMVNVTGASRLSSE
jgi:hypothetical protein